MEEECIPTTKRYRCLIDKERKTMLSMRNLCWTVQGLFFKSYALLATVVDVLEYIRIWRNVLLLLVPEKTITFLWFLPLPVPNVFWEE